MIEMPLTEIDRASLTKRFKFFEDWSLFITIPFMAIGLFLFFKGIFDSNHIIDLLFSFLCLICAVANYVMVLFLDRHMRTAIKSDLDNDRKLVVTGTYRDIDPWYWCFDIKEVETGIIVPVRYQPLINELSRIIACQMVNLSHLRLQFTQDFHSRLNQPMPKFRQLSTTM